MINVNDFRRIDYAALGAHLEHNATTSELVQFACVKYPDDRALCALAAYARFTATARRARLDGDIETALNCERRAHSVYEQDIQPENRW